MFSGSLWAGLRLQCCEQQMDAAQKIGELHEQWIQAVHKNVEIDAACRQIEEQISALKGDGRQDGQQLYVSQSSSNIAPAHEHLTSGAAQANPHWTGKQVGSS